MILGVNRTNNRQLWFADMASLTSNTPNPVITFRLGGTTSTSYIDAFATDGTTRQSLSIGGDAIITNTSSYAALRKILKFTGVAVADDVACMND